MGPDTGLNGIKKLMYLVLTTINSIISILEISKLRYRDGKEFVQII